jgi:hypothetical protein
MLRANAMVYYHSGKRHHVSRPHLTFIRVRIQQDNAPKAAMIYASDLQQHRLLPAQQMAIARHQAVLVQHHPFRLAYHRPLHKPHQPWRYDELKTHSKFAMRFSRTSSFQNRFEHCLRRMWYQHCCHTPNPRSLHHCLLAPKQYVVLGERL